MKGTDLYSQILGVQKPWKVTEVRSAISEGEIVIVIQFPSSRKPRCPKCDQACSIYDHRKRRWRHLPTCQYRTILEVDVPRIKCPTHGVLQVQVPWAEENSSFTALFEAFVISWLKEASTLAVTRLLDITWDQVDGIMKRAVARGLERRVALTPTHIGVDETSFQKRHEYVTVVHDLQTSEVLWVADGHGKEALNEFYEGLPEKVKERIQAITMDMWKPYIFSTAAHIPEAEKKIAFDRFHVVQHLSKAVDKVRREEHRKLMKDGDESLKGSKYLWLTRKDLKDKEKKARFKTLKESSLKTARAWALKETAANIWGYTTRGWAIKAWKKWLSWALRSRLKPMVKAAKMIRYHLVGILNADLLGVTNARAESINAKIQRIKARACGFRNRERFRNAIYFHLGGLDLIPRVI